ncbi:hypothetical protein OAV62_00335 [bacterium]|nr:hypothetical protein [bacterium]
MLAKILLCWLPLLLVACTTSVEKVEIEQSVKAQLKLAEPVIDGKLIRVVMRNIESCSGCQHYRGEVLKSYRSELKPQAKSLLLDANLFTGNAANPMKVVVTPLSLVMDNQRESLGTIGSPMVATARFKYEVIPLGRDPIMVSMVETKAESYLAMGAIALPQAAATAMERNVITFGSKLRNSFYNGTEPLSACCEFDDDQYGQRFLTFLATSPFLLMSKTGEALEVGMSAASAYAKANPDWVNSGSANESYQQKYNRIASGGSALGPEIDTISLKNQQQYQASRSQYQAPESTVKKSSTAPKRNASAANIKPRNDHREAYDRNCIETGGQLAYRDGVRSGCKHPDINIKLGAGYNGVDPSSLTGSSVDTGGNTASSGGNGQRGSAAPKAQAGSGKSVKNKSAQPSSQLVIESVAFCWENSSRTDKWRCHGPVQLTPLFEEGLLEQAENSGCTNPSNNVKQAWSSGDKQGYVVHCQEPLRKSDKDVADHYTMPNYIRVKRKVYKCGYPIMNGCSVYAEGQGTTQNWRVMK